MGCRFKSIPANTGHNKPSVIHSVHHSYSTEVPLHPSHTGPYGPNGEQRPGVEISDATTPLHTSESTCDEFVLTKHTDSSFIGRKVLDLLNERKIKTLIIAGLTTDNCVSNTTCVASSLAAMGEWGSCVESLSRGLGVDPTEGHLSGAQATHPRGLCDAETVHAVNKANLKGEFAEVMTTQDAVNLFVADRRQVA